MLSQRCGTEQPSLLSDICQSASLLRALVPFLPNAVAEAIMRAGGYEPPTLRQNAHTGGHDIESAQPSQHEQHASAGSGGTGEGLPEHDIPGQATATRWTVLRAGLCKAVSCRSRDTLLLPLVLARFSPYGLTCPPCMADEWLAWQSAGKLSQTWGYAICSVLPQCTWALVHSRLCRTSSREVSVLSSCTIWMLLLKFWSGLSQSSGEPPYHFWRGTATADHGS